MPTVIKQQPQSSPQIPTPIITTPIKLNIKLIIQDQYGKTTQQFIQQFLINECMQDALSLGKPSAIILKKLLLILKNQMNYPLQNKQIYFLLDKCSLYMNCGIDPINQDIKIKPLYYKNRQFITIKAKDLGVSMVHRLMAFQNTIGSNNQQKQKGGIDQMAQRSKCRRTKQRRIGHIIDKVIEWRKFYSGAINDKNQLTKFSLEDAAKEVKISKKSLDDYLFQIRFGHKFGFNFNQHYNDKVGVLRDYVRQRKKTDKFQNKNRKTNTKGNQKEEF